MPNIYLVRHGDYEYRDRASATDGQALTERGRLQAAATGAWLSNKDREICLVLSINYTRAMQTADLIAKSFPRAKRVSEEMFQECADFYFSDADGQRVFTTRAFDQLFGVTVRHRASTVVVSHANLIRYLLARLEN